MYLLLTVQVLNLGVMIIFRIYLKDAIFYQFKRRGCIIFNMRIQGKS